MTASYNELQNRNQVSTTLTSIWLEETENGAVVMEYCGTCRSPLFQHQGALVMKVPGNSPSRLPLFLQCRNPNCGRKYKIHMMYKS